MLTSTVELSTLDGPMAVYEAIPDAPARAAVVVVQEAFGVNDHIRDVTQRFAALGFHAVAPSIVHRTGGGTAPYDDFAQAGALFAGVSDKAIFMDIDATLEHLHQAGFVDARIGIVGWCIGGRVAFLVAAHRELGAGVTFYGGGIVTPNPLFGDPLMDTIDHLRSPWLGLFGDQDTGIPFEQVERLRAELPTLTSLEAEIVRYPEAGHGFHCDARPDYREGPARDAWGRTVEWLERHLLA
jgi:carboxymethylenebutenolidase